MSDTANFGWDATLFVISRMTTATVGAFDWEMDNGFEGHSLLLKGSQEKWHSVNAPDGSTSSITMPARAHPLRHLWHSHVPRYAPLWRAERAMVAFHSD